MNKIVIENVVVEANRLECTYSVSGEWKMYFKETNIFFAEYLKVIDSVPQSVAIIPFLCNILPVVWIFDGEVVLNEIDKDFFDSIEDFKRGFIHMYPELSFKGRVSPKRVVDNTQDGFDKTAAFFSSGVDAYNTLISHMDENPILVTIWGADITFEDQKGWNLVDQHIRSVASGNELEYISIKTSFRRFLEDGALSEYVIKRTGNNWWYGFQHGIGIIGHVAPIAYQNKVKTTYIASSLIEEDNTTCASDPSIDNFVKFCSSQVIHDGYSYSRQEKVNRISNYVNRTKTPVQLRVCWESEGGSNCCNCEKCHLTILCLLAGKNDPREYGFHYADEKLPVMMKDFREEIHFVHPSCIVLYKMIQKELRKNYEFNQVDQSLRWYYKTDLEKILSYKNRFIYRLRRKVKKHIGNKMQTLHKNTNANIHTEPVKHS